MIAASHDPYRVRVRCMRGIRGARRNTMKFFRESWAKAGWETRKDAPLTGLITIVDYPAADGEAAPEDTSFVCVGDGVRMQVAPPIATRADLPTEEQALRGAGQRR
jgi:hypothetical protein